MQQLQCAHSRLRDLRRIPGKGKKFFSSSDCPYFLWITCKLVPESFSWFIEDGRWSFIIVLIHMCGAVTSTPLNVQKDSFTTALSAEAIDLGSPYWILHPVSCHTPEAVTTVFKCSWGWTQKASETCRVLLQLLINILPSCITLVLYIY